MILVSCRSLELILRLIENVNSFGELKVGLEKTFDDFVDFVDGGADVAQHDVVAFVVAKTDQRSPERIK
jgi:hypothetical protein